MVSEMLEIGNGRQNVECSGWSLLSRWGLDEEDLPPIFGCTQTVVYAVFEKHIMASAICVVWYKLQGWPWWPSKVLVHVYTGTLSLVVDTHD